MLIVAGSFAGRGGLQRRLSDLASSLAPHRKVTVLTWRARARPCSTVRADGVRIVVVPSVLDWGTDHHPAAAALNTLLSVATGVMAAVLLRRHWSVACAAGLQPEGTVGAISARGQRSFVVMTWSVGALGNAERLKRSVAARFVLRLLMRARWFIAETSDAAAELVALGLPHDRVRTFIAGVDMHRWQPPNRRVHGRPADTKSAVYFGRFDLTHKQLDLLLEAWAAARLSGWQLVLAGAGEDERIVRRMAAAQASARVLGWQEDVYPLLASAELFVLPTIAETSSLAMLEAMACGVPGIVSATSTMLARRPAGVVLVDNRVDAWIDGLHTIDALGPEGRREAGRLARQWVEVNADLDESTREWRRLLS